MDKSDEETKKFMDSIQKRLAAYVGNDSVDVRLRGKGDKSFTAWISLKDGKDDFKFDNSFPGETLKDSNPKIGAFTLVSPEDKRVVRISRDEDGARLYQILNESCTIKFNWKVDDRDCSITLNISRRNDRDDNDRDYDVACTGLSDNTSLEDLKKNNAVKIKIGYYENKKFDKYNDMTLAKLASLAPNLQGISSEVVEINPTSTSLTNIKTQNVSQSQHSQNSKQESPVH